MRRLPLTMLVLAALAAATTPARADAPVTYGRACNLTPTGLLTVGPVVLFEADGATPESGTVTCRVQYGNPDHTGSGPQLSVHSTGYFFGGPIPVPPGGFLCAEFTDDSDGVTYYLDATLDEWSTSVSTPCERAVATQEVQEQVIDPLVCAVLKVVFPPSGDIPGLWDCPPYQS